MASKTPKRVSLKGRGADLFFGDYTPPEAPVAGVPTSVAAEAAAVEDVAASLPPPSDAVGAAAEPVALVDLTVPPVGRPSENGRRGSASAAERQERQSRKHVGVRSSKLASTVPDISQDSRASTQAPVDAGSQSSKHASTASNTPGRAQPDVRAGDVASSRSSKLASNPASRSTGGDAREPAGTAAVTAEAVEAIRRAVREPGREVAYVRLTPEEKGLVGDIVHAYKKRGQRTTENELHRIAINHLLQDYHEHGERSVLARVLASLLA